MPFSSLKKIFLFLMILFSPPALAGDRYCNNGLTYDIETIPYGFAVVRINQADYCKRVINIDTGELSEKYICDGRNDYQLMFKIDGGELILTFMDGNEAILYKC